jgi:hypothetical protein
MRSFRDKEGRRWDVSVDAGTVKRVRDLTGFDLLSILEQEGKSLHELRDNPELLVNVAYAACKPQVDAYQWRKPFAGRLGGLLWRFGIGQAGDGRQDEAFGVAMGGDALDSAWEALLHETADFFPRGRRRILKAVLEMATAELATTQAVDSLLPTPGRNCSRWRGASAWCRGALRSLSCGRWTKRITSEMPSSTESLRNG